MMKLIVVFRNFNEKRPQASVKCRRTRQQTTNTFYCVATFNPWQIINPQPNALS